MKVRKELIENANVIQIATPEERAWAAGYTDCLREIGTMDVDRLRELAEADKDGRVVVLEETPAPIKPCNTCNSGWGAVSSSGCDSCYNHCERLTQYKKALEKAKHGDR